MGSKGKSSISFLVFEERKERVPEFRETVAVEERLEDGRELSGFGAPPEAIISGSGLGT